MVGSTQVAPCSFRFEPEMRDGSSSAESAAVDTAVTWPWSSETEGMISEMADDTIAGSDWLDVTHAMLDANDDQHLESG